MDIEAIKTQMKLLKGKARAARKAGKKSAATAFKNGASRLHRRIKGVRTTPTKKADG